MTKSRLRGINTRLDIDLYQTVKDISILNKIPLRNIFDDALRLYIAREQAKNPNLLDALQIMKKRVKINRG